jgi:hypothetical protein
MRLGNADRPSDCRCFDFVLASRMCRFEEGKPLAAPSRLTHVLLAVCSYAGDSFLQKELMEPREATHGVTGTCGVCRCGVEGDGGRENIRLGCRCLIHFECLSQCVKGSLCLVNAEEVKASGGIRCPASGDLCQRAAAEPYVLGISELQALATPGCSTAPGQLTPTR